MAQIKHHQKYFQEMEIVDYLLIVNVVILIVLVLAKLSQN